MKHIAAELETLIEKHLPALHELPSEKFSLKPLPGKWSKKEITGHLIDSAESNIRRFVIAQYEESPVIIYDQDKWVTIANYQQWDKTHLINLWYLLNKQACEILKNISAETAQRICMSETPNTIEWLAVDYIKHLRHHLHQLLELEHVPYP